jgi:glycosyltransferase involved in cell wall biosynthesis
MLAGAPLANTWRRRRDRLVRRLTHVFVFGDSQAPRWLARAYLGRRLTPFRELFDADFYLAQAPPGVPRTRAARDPLLHFWLVGARQGRSPHPDFDAEVDRKSWPDSRPGDGAYIGRLMRSVARRSRCDNPRTDARGRTALLFDHARGGGSSQLLRLHGERLAAEGWAVVLLRRVGQETPLVVLPTAEGGRPYDLFADEAALAQAAKDLGVRRLVINHLIDLPDGAAAWLKRFAQRIGADYEILLHDYYLACPRIDLIDSDGRYCGLAAEERCRGCLAKSGALSAVDPAEWRAQSASLLADAARIIAPSRDLADRLMGAFPGSHIVVQEPEDDSELPRTVTPPRVAPSEAMRVLLLGALNRPKGLWVTVNLARILARRHAPVRITLLGPAADPPALRRSGVRVLGRYRPEDLKDLLAAEKPHVIFFPAIWPETWSFVLTQALRAEAEILAFDIGAISERLKRLGRGRLLAHELHDQPEALADAVLDLRREMTQSAP